MAGTCRSKPIPLKAENAALNSVRGLFPGGQSQSHRVRPRAFKLKRAVRVLSGSIRSKRNFVPALASGAPPRPTSAAQSFDSRGTGVFRQICLLRSHLFCEFRVARCARLNRRQRTEIIRIHTLLPPVEIRRNAGYGVNAGFPRALDVL